MCCWFGTHSQLPTCLLAAKPSSAGQPLCRPVLLAAALHSFQSALSRTRLSPCRQSSGRAWSSTGCCRLTPAPAELWHPRQQHRTRRLDRWVHLCLCARVAASLRAGPHAPTYHASCPAAAPNELWGAASCSKGLAAFASISFNRFLRPCQPPRQPFIGPPLYSPSMPDQDLRFPTALQPGAVPAARPSEICVCAHAAVVAGCVRTPPVPCN